MSHPMWVRGLKRAVQYAELLPGESHPMWVRGLKRLLLIAICALDWSHPMWVRGLKLIVTKDINKATTVAPHVGAWIETHSTTANGKH